MNLPFQIRLKAGVLSLVLSFSLVIITLITALILLAYYYRLEATRIKVEDQLLVNTHSGIQYLLAQPESNYFDQLFFDLYDLSTDSILLRKGYWGLFDMLQSTAYNQNHKKNQSSLSGYHLSELAKASLYLADLNRPLSIAGNTLIKGNVYLPEAGVRSTYIERQGYSKAKLVYGQQLQSNDALPLISEIGLQKINFYLNNEFANQAYYLELLPDTLIASFNNAPTSLFFSEQDVFLYQKLKGNLIVRSATRIMIDSIANLEDIILIAPAIEFAAGFSGNVQAFATDSIIINENVRLQYPSSLTCYSADHPSTVIIKPNAWLQACLFVLGDENFRDQRLVYR